MSVYSSKIERRQALVLVIVWTLLGILVALYDHLVSAAEEFLMRGEGYNFVIALAMCSISPLWHVPSTRPGQIAIFNPRHPRIHDPDEQYPADRHPVWHPLPVDYHLYAA